MVDDEQERYPISDSYADDLFAMEESAFEERFERAYADFGPGDVAESDVSAADVKRLESFVRLHREILRGERESRPKAPFRPVPSGRTFGMLRWFDPRRATVLGAHFPPLHGEPASLAVGFPLPDDVERAYRAAFGDRETRRFEDLRSALRREDVGVP